MRQLRILAVAAALPIVPATAATTNFGGTAQVRLGYVDNPFLENNPPGGTVQIGGTIAPRLTRTTSEGKTVLSGSYSREEYASHYHYSDTILASLSHDQQLSEHLKAHVNGDYSNSLNPFLGGEIDPTQVDLLTVGQRSRRLSGEGGFDWTPSARESVSFSANGSHSSYGQQRIGAIASDYTSYGVSGSYMRVLSQRTRVGLQMVYNHTDSGLYGTSNSYQPNLILQHDLSQYWKFNGSVGGIFQNSSGPLSTSSKSLGFNAELCGTYPRHTLCFTGSRQSSASGVGGLRTELRLGSTFTYRLNQRSSISADVLYSNSSQTTTGLNNIPSQRFAQAGANYNRDLSRKISAGFGARYQWRDYRGISKAHAITATINLSARFGRQ